MNFIWRIFWKHPRIIWTYFFSFITTEKNLWVHPIITRSYIFSPMKAKKFGWYMQKLNEPTSLFLRKLLDPHTFNNYMNLFLVLYESCRFVSILPSIMRTYFSFSTKDENFLTYIRQLYEIISLHLRQWILLSFFNESQRIFWYHPLINESTYLSALNFLLDTSNNKMIFFSFSTNVMVSFK